MMILSAFWGLVQPKIIALVLVERTRARMGATTKGFGVAVAVAGSNTRSLLRQDKQCNFGRFVSLRQADERLVEWFDESSYLQIMETNESTQGKKE